MKDFEVVICDYMNLGSTFEGHCKLEGQFQNQA